MSGIGAPQVRAYGTAHFESLRPEEMGAILSSYLRDIVAPSHVRDVIDLLAAQDYEGALKQGALDFAHRLRSLPAELLEKFCSLYCADPAGFWRHADAISMLAGLAGQALVFTPLGHVLNLGHHVTDFLFFLLKRYRLLEELCGCDG
jgi:hypothetical protein